MRRFVIFIFIAALIASCSSSGGGELVGVDGRKAYAEPDPFGMVPIPTGSFVMGPSDQDVTWTQNSMSKTVAVEPASVGTTRADISCRSTKTENRVWIAARSSILFVLEKYAQSKHVQHH